MRLEDYYRNILVPANVAVSALRRAGLPVDLDRVHAIAARWQTELERLEAFVEGEAAERGFALKYSAAHGCNTKELGQFLYSPKGLGLTVSKETPTHQPSTDDEALMDYASIKVPQADDDPIVTAVLKIRSLAKGLGTYLVAFERTRRADGACHPQFKWNLRTPRLAAENPPVHQIPERADQEVADAIKSIFVPRVNPAPNVEVWDPRIHGTCFRWDIVGAEACIRAAMLTARYCSRPDPVAYEYLRLGKDIHSKTASLIYNVPEGTYKKGSYQRDAVGKQTFFAKIFGAKWSTVQGTVWKEARVRLSDEEAQAVVANFDAGYPSLVELYELDKIQLGETGYCTDGYGRRRWVGVPPGVVYKGVGSDGKAKWDVRGSTEDERRLAWWRLDHNFHVMANTPTQGMNATDTLWMLALCYLGEYVELRVPPLWESKGVDFPKAAAWRLHEGPGPGGKPLRAWHSNTVHDSGWGDCAPGHLEPAAQVIWRRCRALPFDWRLEADVPYRIELSVGPNMGTLYSYNKIAAQFGLDPLPE